MSTFFFAGEPLPLAPSLKGMDEAQRTELEAFHSKLLDYLRRLGAKLSSERFSPVASTGIDTLALALDSNYQLDGSSWQDIKWDLQLRVDNSFSHSITVNPAQITIVQDGYYLILADINLDDTWLFRIIDGDGDTLDYGGHSQSGSLTASNNSTVMIATHFHAEQIIRMQLFQSTDSLDANNTRLVILRLGNLTSSNPDSPDPCELNPWQLCPE